MSKKRKKNKDKAATAPASVPRSAARRPYPCTRCSAELSGPSEQAQHNLDVHLDRT